MSGCAGTVARVTAPGSSTTDPALHPVLRLSALDLRPLPGAVPSARLHARFVLREWGFPAIAPDCELIVSELVTNAVTHGARVVTAADLPPVRLRLTGRARGIQIEVWDASDEMPQMHCDPLSEEPGGRGLVLVAAIASRWGAYRTAGGRQVRVRGARHVISPPSPPGPGHHPISQPHVTHMPLTREEPHPVTTTTDDAAARHVLASDPLLRWDAIAAHARDHHGHAWPTDKAARTAITGAFDAIIPSDCSYSPAEGTISAPPPAAPPGWAPAWTDPQGLNCTIAALAASAADCDLQDIYNEINIPNPPGSPSRLTPSKPGRPYWRAGRPAWTPGGSSSSSARLAGGTSRTSERSVNARRSGEGARPGSPASHLRW